LELEQYRNLFHLTGCQVKNSLGVHMASRMNRIKEPPSEGIGSSFDAVARFFNGGTWCAPDPLDQLRRYLRSVASYQAKSVPPNQAHRSIEEFVHEEGWFFSSELLTPDERRYVKECRRRYRARTPVRECYSNCQRFLLSADREGRLSYGEGFAHQFFIVPHAWLLINGKVIDPTWKQEEGLRDGYGSWVVGEWTDARAYYGVTFQREEVREFVLSRNTCGSLIDDPAGGFPFLRRKAVAP
jgi:hypothetical protein